MLVGRPYIDVCLMVKGGELDQDQLKQLLNNFCSSFSIEIDIKTFGPEDPVKGKKPISKWFIACYKKSQEKTTIHFVNQLTDLERGNMLIADENVLELCETLSENFNVHDLVLTVFSVTKLTDSFMESHKEPLQIKEVDTQGAKTKRKKSDKNSQEDSILIYDGEKGNEIEKNTDEIGLNRVSEVNNFWGKSGI